MCAYLIGWIEVITAFTGLFHFAFVYQTTSRVNSIYGQEREVLLQGPVAPSMVSTNHLLRSIKAYMFLWQFTLVYSANHASSNLDRALLTFIGKKLDSFKTMFYLVQNEFLFCITVSNHETFSENENRKGRCVQFHPQWEVRFRTKLERSHYYK